MGATPRHASVRSTEKSTWAVVLLLVVCVIAVAVVVPQVLTDAEACVRLLAFLIDLARIAL